MRARATRAIARAVERAREGIPRARALGTGARRRADVDERATASERSSGRGADETEGRTTTAARARTRGEGKTARVGADGSRADGAREGGATAETKGRETRAKASGGRGVGSSGAPGRGGERGKRYTASGLVSIVVDAVKEEYRLAMMDPGDAAAARRKAMGYDKDAAYEPYEGTTAVAMTPEKEPTAFGKLWRGVREKLGIPVVMDKLEGVKKTAAYAKAGELAEDIRERWETSDSPMVHRIQDLQDSMFTETEQAEAYRLIRSRDPMFNTNDFIAEVRRDIPKVLGAYLRGDVDALKETNISKEMLERLSGQMNLWKAEGQFVDPRILDLSEVELMEVRMMENEPLVVLTFSCQQINCVRDKSGKIVEGGEDDIQSVHYLWAMQLVDTKFTTDDGREYMKPTWVLRELVLRGMMAVAA